MEKAFIRVRSIKDIVVFISLIILGTVLTASPVGEAANIAGFFIVFTGAILAFILPAML